MKKILLAAFILISTISCTVGDDTSTNFILLPVESFDTPSSFKVDSISTFKIKYKRESDCQIFNGIYLNGTETDVKIAIKIAELQDNTCYPDETVYEVPLYFKPTHSGTYVFNFWSGKDPNGEDQFSNTQIIVP